MTSPSPAAALLPSATNTAQPPTCQKCGNGIMSPPHYYFETFEEGNPLPAKRMNGPYHLQCWFDVAPARAPSAPSQDVVEQVAKLICGHAAVDECNDAESYFAAATHHSGDCTNECHTCILCRVTLFRNLARQVLATARAERDADPTERFEWQPIAIAPRKAGVEILGVRIAGDKVIREPFISFWSPTLDKFYCDPTHYILMPRIAAAPERATPLAQAAREGET